MSQYSLSVLLRGASILALSLRIQVRDLHAPLLLCFRSAEVSNLHSWIAECPPIMVQHRRTAPSSQSMVFRISAVRVTVNTTYNLWLIISKAVFSKVLALAPAVNLRFVAVTRRDYKGSTPLTPNELNVLSNGTNAEKSSFLRDRGAEFANFISRFIQSNNIPPPTTDGKYGGIALLGWSFGNSFALATVANVHTYPKPVKNCLEKYLRALIMQGMRVVFKANSLLISRSPAYRTAVGCHRNSPSSPNLLATD